MKKKLYSKILVLSALGCMGVAGLAGVASIKEEQPITIAKADELPAAVFVSIEGSTWNPHATFKANMYTYAIKLTVNGNKNTWSKPEGQVNLTDLVGDKVTVDGVPLKDAGGKLDNTHGAGFVTLQLPQSLNKEGSINGRPLIEFKAGITVEDSYTLPAMKFQMHTDGALCNMFDEGAGISWNNLDYGNFSASITGYTNQVPNKGYCVLFGLKRNGATASINARENENGVSSSNNTYCSMKGSSFANLEKFVKVNGVALTSFEDYLIGTYAGMIYIYLPETVGLRPEVEILPGGYVGAEKPSSKVIPLFVPAMTLRADGAMGLHSIWSEVTAKKAQTPVTYSTIAWNGISYDAGEPYQYQGVGAKGILVSFDKKLSSHGISNGTDKLHNIAYGSAGSKVRYNGTAFKDIADSVVTYFQTIYAWFFTPAMQTAKAGDVLEMDEGIIIDEAILPRMNFKFDGIWKPATKIVFDTQNGNAIEPYFGITGTEKLADIAAAKIPTRSGYRFAGWKVSDAAIAADAVCTGLEQTFVATWVEQVTITFENSDVKAQSIDINGKATKPADPEKEGFDFLGWFEDSTFDTPFDFNSTISANKTIYAKFVAHTYNKVDEVPATYDAEGCKEHYTCDNCNKLFVYDEQQEKYVETTAEALVIPSLLGAYKTEQKTVLSTYLDSTKYRQEQQEAIQTALETANTAIDGAADKTAVDNAVAVAKEVLDAIKTDATLTAEELAAAKTQAKTDLDEYRATKLDADYRADQVTELNAAVTAGKEAIDACTVKTEVEPALKAAKDALDAVKTNAQLTAEETQAAQAIEALIDAITATEYGQTLLSQYTTAFTAYKNASAAVKALVSAAKVNKMNAIYNAIYYINEGLYVTYQNMSLLMGSDERRAELDAIFTQEANKIIVAAYTAGAPDSQAAHPIYDAYLAGVDALEAVPMFIEDQISSIPEVIDLEATFTVIVQDEEVEYSLEQFIAYIEAEIAYYSGNENTAWLVEYVDNQQSLTDAKAAVEVAKLIAAIGEVEYTPESKAKIDAARAAYNDLTAEQQARVDVTPLTTAEAAYQSLKATAEALAAAKTEAKETLQAAYDALDLTKYSAENQTALAEALEAGKAAIDGATDTAGVTSAVQAAQNALAAVSEIPPSKGCGGSAVAASALVAGLALAGAALVARKRKDEE